MEAAGFHVVAAVEYDCAAAVTYMTNLCAYPLQLHFVTDEDEARLEKYLAKAMKKGGVFTSGCYRKPTLENRPPPTEHFWFGDIRKLTGKQILDALGMQRGEIDCVVGGPPCQGFSLAGKREVMDPRNSLVFEFARMILEIWPKTMVMENVPGILSMTTEDGVPVVDAFCRILGDGSFSTFDALRKSIVGDARGALRGQKVSRPDRKKKRLKKTKRVEKRAAVITIER